VLERDETAQPVEALLMPCAPRLSRAVCFQAVATECGLLAIFDNCISFVNNHLGALSKNAGSMRSWTSVSKEAQT